MTENVNIQETIVNAVKKQMNIKDDLNIDAAIVADLGADSLDIVEIIMAIEDGLDFQIPDEEAEKIVTVRDAINIAERLIEELDQ